MIFSIRNHGQKYASSYYVEEAYKKLLKVVIVSGGQPVEIINKDQIGSNTYTQKDSPEQHALMHRAV